MKLIVDMNLSPRWAAFLSDAGHQAAHWRMLGRPDASDVEIMQYASANGSIVVSHDLDFGSILAASGDIAPSVVIIRSDTLAIAGIGTQVLAGLRQFEAELLSGSLLVIHPQRTRVRLLPIGPAAGQ